jgi:hypothetical protein
MTSTKYIGMDVHKESISIAVMNTSGKIGMESVIETKASMILQFWRHSFADRTPLILLREVSASRTTRRPRFLVLLPDNRPLVPPFRRESGPRT